MNRTQLRIGTIVLMLKVLRRDSGSSQSANHRLRFRLRRVVYFGRASIRPMQPPFSSRMTADPSAKTFTRGPLALTLCRRGLFLAIFIFTRERGRQAFAATA